MDPLSSFCVRLAQPANLDSVLAIRRDAILALAPRQLTEEAAARWAGSPDRPARCRAAIVAERLWLAQLADAPAGWLEVTKDFVDGLFVAPDCWRRGIGSRLMDFAERMIRDAGFAAARLDAAYEAERFYARRGYTASGPRPPNRGTPMTKVLA